MRRRRLRSLLAIPLGGAIAIAMAGVLTAGCSGKTIEPAGLMLVMSTDGTLAEPTRLHVDVLSPDGKTPYLSRDYSIPEETTLPTTLGIATTGSPTSAFLLNVSLFADAKVLDDRQHQIFQIPSDHVAELDIVFSSLCTTHATASGLGATSTCADGYTCDPADGSCSSDARNASDLPVFNPSAAGADAGVGGGTDSGPSTVAEAGVDRTYAIGGTVTGLGGGSLKLHESGGNDDVTVSANGPFVFANRLKSGASYVVTVTTEPSSPAQLCTLAAGTDHGTVMSSDVTGVSVTCAKAGSVGGDVIGLASGDSVVLQDNGGDDLTVAANGPFRFATALPNGQAYNVTVGKSPSAPVAQQCLVTSGSGDLVAGQAVNNVRVVCGPPTYAQIALGSESSHECATTKDGALWCWGANLSHQLGDSTTTSRNLPERVGSSTAWTSLAVGQNFSCGLQAVTGGGNALWCWGANDSYQLGDMTTMTRAVPEPIGTMTTWTSVALGGAHSCALQSDQSAWCWGNNAHQQTGVNDTLPPSAPRSVATGIRSISLGLAHTCALTSGGAVSCWGDNTYGQLGSNPSGTWKAIAAGGNHTCGIQTDNSLWCWGLNDQGQLGIGSTMNESAPQAVKVGSTWSSIALGAEHSCGVQMNGTLWCWGDDSYGELGDGMAGTMVQTPMQVGMVSTWAFLSLGLNRTCAQRVDGSFWCWGTDSDGALGDGLTTTTPQTTPEEAP